ncbi:MAG: class II aldolase/adducin family protein [Pseudomonadota bacterium]
MKVDEQEMRDSLVNTYRELVAMSLTDQASGNISCRVDGGMLISCSGATAKNLTVDRVVKVLDDASWEGDVRPSSEWRMHHAIYQRNKSANAVVHTHSDYCVAMACNNLALPGFHYMVGTFGGSDVPCVPYSTFGTEQLARDAAEALVDRTATLLGNHGMICRGVDLADALGHAERMEILCKHYALARQLGKPDLLTDEQWDEYFARAKEEAYGQLS